MLFGDGIILLVSLAIIAFFAFPATRELYLAANTQVPELLSFIKFAILATGGEIIALRLKGKQYNLKHFGILPKMLIWGIFGIFIYWAFGIFSTEVPQLFPFLKKIADPWSSVLTAFAISLFLNLIFSPVLMLSHHVTDGIIIANNGAFPLFKIDTVAALNQIDWNRMWKFVFMKTIPFFWIPAHTITFMLPPQYRVLFAAGLSVVLGLILGSVKNQPSKIEAGTLL
jgi:hypothetical protein